jgi:two-component system, chemotaxis family, response regulator Rcp1
MQSSMQSPSIVILLVEDDNGDIELIKTAMEEAAFAADLKIVRDGVQAMDYLYRKQPYTDVPPPDLILLDLNMPRMNGKMVLQQIKADETLKSIPVVILTTSRANGDIIDTYRAGANCYITKPGGYHDFIEMIGIIKEFWFSVVKLPPKLQ